MATVKSIAALFSSFLSHHSRDLDATASVLAQVLAAIPVNAETRSQINDAIDRVRDSAVNIENSLVKIIGNTDGADVKPAAVKISQDDIDKAVARTLPDAVAAYLKAHPPQPVAVSPTTGEVVQAPKGGPDNSEALATAGDTADGKAPAPAAAASTGKGK